MTSSILVLAVEDEELIRNLLEDALKEGGFTVALVATGEEAIAMVDSEGANYSALVTDISLPGKLSGWDVARHTREIHDTVPVIYMS